MTQRPPALLLALVAVCGVWSPGAVSAQDAADGTQEKTAWDYDAPGYSRDPDHPDYTPYSPFYTGAFLAAGAFAGPSLLGADGLEGASGLTAGAWLQASSPLQVLDGRFSWYGTSADLALTDGRAVQLRQDTFAFTAGAHPLFLTHLENNRLFYALSSAYLLGGVDIDVIQTTLDGRDATSWDLGILLGAGFDVPLDDMDDGGAFWLGFQYVYNPWDLTLEGVGDLDVGQHLFMVQLGYRRNGLQVVVPPVEHGEE